MPRDRRPRRTATNRTNWATQPTIRSRMSSLRSPSTRPNRGKNGPSQTTSAAPFCTQVHIPRLFPKLATNQPDTPSNLQQKVFCLKLRQHIDLALRASTATAKPLKMSSYADFYDLVNRMMLCKTRPSVYAIATEAIRDWFGCFAGKLTMQLACPSPSSTSSQRLQKLQNLMPARALIEFHQQFFGKTIRLLAAAYMPAERRILKCPSESVQAMQLHELCCHQFVEAILAKPLIVRYLIDTAVLFFSRARQRLNDEFLCQIKAIDYSDWSSFHKQLTLFYEQKFLSNGTQAESCSLVRSLIMLLIELDQKNLSVFLTFLEMPLIKQSLQHAQQLSRDLLMNSKISMTDYLHWVAMYLQMDHFLLVEQFGFPVKSAQNMAKLFCHWMVAKKMDTDIVLNGSSGFATLLKQFKHEQLRLMYKQIQWLYEKTRQSALFTALERHIEAQFTEQKNKLSSRYHFKSRTEMMAYVQKMLSLKTRWDCLLDEVFQTGAERIKQIVFNFFYESLLIHEGVHQAFAFFMHHILQKGTLIPAGLRLNEEESQVLFRSEKVRFMFSSDQMARFVVLCSLLDLLEYVKDVNTFYDYTRHYFCTRLLKESSALTIEQELGYFSMLTAEIKRLYVDDPALVNSSSLVSRASLPLVHKHFTHSINGFRRIKIDWGASDAFFNGSSLRAVPGPSAGAFIESFRILHAGIWKLIDYDRCRIPESIAISFRCVELLHQTKWKNKRLLLNTKYSKAILSARLCASQPKPLSLCVSLHQLAILSQFNLQPDLPQAPMIRYEQIIEGAGFLKQYNTRLALLSLVHAGLLNAHLVNGGSGGSTVLFEIDRRFYNANHANGGIINLSTLEEHDFWGHKSVDNKTANLIRAIGAMDDIQLTSSTASVEDVAQNCLLIYQSDSAATIEEGKRSTGIPGHDGTSKTSEDLPSGSSFQFKSRSTSGQEVSSSTGSPLVRHQVVDRVIKIEAAIVRVLKRAHRLSSVHEILQHTEQALFSGRGPFPRGEVITFEEVSKILLKLVDQKYIKRCQSGGFEYVVD